MFKLRACEDQAKRAHRLATLSLKETDIKSIVTETLNMYEKRTSGVVEMEQGGRSDDDEGLAAAAALVGLIKQEADADPSGVAEEEGVVEEEGVAEEEGVTEVPKKRRGGKRSK